MHSRFTAPMIIRIDTLSEEPNPFDILLTVNQKGGKKGCPCRRASTESPQDFNSKWVAVMGASFHVDEIKEDPTNKTLQCGGPIHNVIEPETWKG